MPAKLDPRLEPILGRRSIRSFAPKEVGENQVQSLLQAAMAAPSACAKDPWRFIVVRDKRALSRIAEGLPNGKMLPKASVGIIVCGEQAAAHDGQLGYLVLDCTAAVENILLAVHALGLGAVWLGVYPREDRTKHVRAALSIPENILPLAALAVGYPAEKKDARTRYKAEYVHGEKW